MNPKRFLQVVAGNALALSALYLAIGVVVEAPPGPVPVHARSSASRTRWMRCRPGCSDRLGLLGPLKEAYTDGRIGESMVRLVFGSRRWDSCSCSRSGSRR